MCPKNAKWLWSNYFFFQYCAKNIGLCSIAPCNMLLFLIFFFLHFWYNFFSAFLYFFLFYKTDIKMRLRAITNWGAIEKKKTMLRLQHWKIYILVRHQKSFRIFRVPIIFSETVEHTVLHRNEFIIFFLLLLTITSTCEEVIFMVNYK